MGNDSSLPKTAGPQVQDGVLSPREIAIADYAAREARLLVIEQCAMVAHRYAEETKHLDDNTPYAALDIMDLIRALAKATQADEAAKDRDHIAAPQSAKSGG